MGNPLPGCAGRKLAERLHPHSATARVLPAQRRCGTAAVCSASAQTRQQLGRMWLLRRSWRGGAASMQARTAALRQRLAARKGSAQHGRSGWNRVQETSPEGLMLGGSWSGVGKGRGYPNTTPPAGRAGAGGRPGGRASRGRGAAAAPGGERGGRGSPARARGRAGAAGGEPAGTSWAGVL